MFVKGMLFMEENILIKLNFKDLKEFMSLIENNKAMSVSKNMSNKNLLCAGKCDKDGWTVILKEKDYRQVKNILNNGILIKYKSSIRW